MIRHKLAIGAAVAALAALGFLYWLAIGLLLHS